MLYIHFVGSLDGLTKGLNEDGNVVKKMDVVYICYGTGLDVLPPLALFKM